MTRSRLTAVLSALVALAAAGLMAAPEARAHETDQYTLPRRDFADLGPYFNAYFYDAIERGVKRVNDRIAAARGSRLSEIKSLQEDSAIVHSVNSEFPNAMSVIEGLDIEFGSSALREAYPGEITGYKETFTNIYEKAHFILDPRQLFRIWLAKTFYAYGVYLGGDKIGHFTDMGMNYWNSYKHARQQGANEDEATAQAIKLGTQGLIFSEKGMLGYLSAGSYSNGDMISNYLGFVFYRNLTSPMMLKGREHPAMVVRDGDSWKIAPHVQRDNDFMAVFFDDHLNEALNPSHYESGMRGKIREAIKQRQNDLLDRYSDVNGLRRPMAWFETKARECFTYYGVDYGHSGPLEELNLLSKICFDPLPAEASPGDRNDRGYTPLHDAVIRGDLARAQALLRAGADVNAQVRSGERFSSEWGATPLHLAARDGQREIVEALLAAGARVSATDDRGATPLHWAAHSTEMIQLLAAHGADVNAVDRFGRTPMHWAANLAADDAIDALAKSGGKASVADRAGCTPLHLASVAGDARAVSRLIDHGADTNAADRYGRTPLHAAVLLRDSETTSFLLSHGAAIAFKDMFGCTPLHDAAGHGRSGSVQALLAKGAASSAGDLSGNTPLHLAARGGHESCVAIIIAARADANARNKAGVTPLHEAAFSGRAGIVTALTRAGSDLAARDSQGRTPQDVARTHGHRDVLALLATPSEGHATASSGSKAM